MFSLIKIATICAPFFLQGCQAPIPEPLMVKVYQYQPDNDKRTTYMASSDTLSALADVDGKTVGMTDPSLQKGIFFLTTSAWSKDHLYHAYPSGFDSFCWNLAKDAGSPVMMLDLSVQYNKAQNEVFAGSGTPQQTPEDMQRVFPTFNTSIQSQLEDIFFPMVQTKIIGNDIGASVVAQYFDNLGPDISSMSGRKVQPVRFLQPVLSAARGEDDVFISDCQILNSAEDTLDIVEKDNEFYPICTLSTVTDGGADKEFLDENSPAQKNTIDAIVKSFDSTTTASPVEVVV